MGARVEPGETPPQNLDLKLAPLQVPPIEIGDLELAAWKYSPGTAK
jgi:hypothetical protein